jgi:hypothetical protein
MDLSRRHCDRTQVPRRNRSPVMRDNVRFRFLFDLFARLTCAGAIFQIEAPIGAVNTVCSASAGGRAGG